MDIANSGVTIAGLIPWCIACAVPLSMLGVGVEACPTPACSILFRSATSSPSAFSSPQNPKEARHRYDLSVGQKIHQKPRGRHLACRAAGLQDAFCGIVGIGFNVLLFALKLLAGALSGSIAITADAFNNLSDAGASIVTLLGFKLAGQKPDPEHPFGHGRLGTSRA